MKCNFKISLPLYKLLYSMVFMFVMALIRPTVTPVEILTVIEPNLCFLAIVLWQIYITVSLEKIE